MACETMLAGMKFSTNGTQNSHDTLIPKADLFDIFIIQR